MIKPRDAQALAMSLRGLGGLGKAVDNPMARIAIRYWWASIPIVLAMWGRYKERRESQKQVHLYQLLSDFGTVIGPVGTFVLLAEFARREERRLQEEKRVKDAEFTIEDENAQEKKPGYTPS